MENEQKEPLVELQESFAHLVEAREVLRQAKMDYEYALRVYNKNRDLMAKWLAEQDNSIIEFNELVGV